jgi:dihydroflavonol-4-reductase
MSSDPSTPSGPRCAFVTGATGLLGSAIVRELLRPAADGPNGGSAGCEEVRALVRDRERAAQLLPDDERLRLVEGDVTDVDSFREQLVGVDAVFHTAAYFREYYEPGSDPGLLRRTNVDAVRGLLEAAAQAQVPVVVHTSSSGTLGATADGSPADEDTPPPRFGSNGNLYFKSKVESEAVVRAFCAERPLRVPIVLPGWMWGPGDGAPTGSGRLFLATAHGLSAVPRAGNHIVDSRDVAAGCVRAAAVGVGERRYIVAGEWHSLAEVCREIASATGARIPREVPARLALLVAGLFELQGRLLRRVPVATRSGVRTLTGERARISSARAQDELGVSFRPLAETLADEATWYRKRGDIAR